MRKYYKTRNRPLYGRWSYTWDAENRLIGMVVNTSAGPQYQLGFAYDAKGRRIEKNVTNGVSVSTINFLYDGWNLIAELQPNDTLVRNYVWGSDLSGTMRGAGGVGGLLEVSYNGTSTTNCFPAFDGNGNVVQLVNANDGTSLAAYEYGPFGEVIRQTGPMAKVSPIRFSTKYQDDESDLLYYGYRYYKASAGIWINRDLIGELGGANLYAFVQDHPISSIDPLGLRCPEGEITFDGKGWELTSLRLKEEGADEADGYGDFPGETAKWQAKVKVKCLCSCPKIVPGTRESEASGNIEIWIYKAGEGPIDIPTPTSLWGLIGELVAKVVDTNIPKSAAMDNNGFNQLKQWVLGNTPKSPSDGHWAGGKSPCDSEK